MASDSLGCRAPDGLAEQYDDAADECEALKAELVRRALRFYAGRNPDGIGAFRDDEKPAEEPAERSRVEEEEIHVGVGDSGVYDPMEEG